MRKKGFKFNFTWAIFIMLILMLSFLRYIVDYEDNLKSKYAKIYVDDALVNSIQLFNAKNTYFKLPQNPNVAIEINDNMISFLSSSCEDKQCVKMGFISQVGQTIQCDTNKIKIIISKTK